MRLHSMATPRGNCALTALCSVLNELCVYYPGAIGLWRSRNMYRVFPDKLCHPVLDNRKPGSSAHQNCTAPLIGSVNGI